MNLFRSEPKWLAEAKRKSESFSKTSYKKHKESEMNWSQNVTLSTPKLPVNKKGRKTTTPILKFKKGAETYQKLVFE